MPVLKLFVGIRRMLGRIREAILKRLFWQGLTRYVGEDKLCIDPACRNDFMPRPYELEWWKILLKEVRAGDTIADIGAQVGIFSVILAKRAGGSGKVMAFEPNPEYAVLLKENIRLNKVSGWTEVHDIAIGDDNKPLFFECAGMDSHVSIPASAPKKNAMTVQSRTLDDFLGDGKLDLVKIDTEGYEANCILGARRLLGRKEGYPRFIFIECHPYMWKGFGVSSKDIMDVLRGSGYTIDLPKLDGNRNLDDIPHHWVMFARK